MVCSAINIRTQVEHGGCATSRVGQLGGDGGSVNAVHGFQYIPGNRHQRTRVASRHCRLCRAGFNLVNGHPHG